MAQDPAFLFYPGDYLRDTQCMSERAQVAYDRIMCSHMRNISITQTQLNFFTRGFTTDELSEVMHVLVPVEGGFKIEWVAESIKKRKDYSESRRGNRTKGKKDGSCVEDVRTHDKHVENANENEKGIVVEDKNLILPNLEKYKSAFEGDYTLDQMVCRENSFSPENLVRARSEFWNSKQLDEEMLGKKYSDVQKHFLNWCRTNAERIKKSIAPNKKDIGDGENYKDSKSAL